jgi:cytoplasmic iron level regulating protein YaaA (DUF328/UPF0246 family)
MLSTPLFLKETEILIRKLRQLSVGDLMTLMRVSNEIAHLNRERFSGWKKPHTLTEYSQPCSFIFTGEVYRALNIKSFSNEELIKAQEQLVILSGLYGVLKPLDLIFPYRLEMGTKWAPDNKNKNLYDFWSAKVTSYFVETLSSDEIIVNLASTEYSKVLDWKKINNQIITPVFKEFKNGEYKVIMMYAKHARGAMARHIIKNKIHETEDLKSYSVDGYSFDDKLSSEKQWVYIR